MTDQLFTIQFNCRFNELSPVEQVEIIRVINTLASHKDGRPTSATRRARERARVKAIRKLLT